MTTLSQFIGPEENLSLSFHSTPGFNDGDFLDSQKRKVDYHEDIIEECKQSNPSQEDSNVKPWSQELQIKDSKLFFKINELQSHQNSHSNHQTYQQHYNAETMKNKDYTPPSLLEKLRDFKHQKENKLQNYTLGQPLSFSSNSRFSLISLKNPAFKLFENIKKERLVRLASSGLGWYDKTLYEDKGLGKFYQMPDQNTAVDYDGWSNKSSVQIKQNAEISKEQQPYDTSNVAKIFKKTRKNRISFSSNTIIDQIIAQSSIIEEQQGKQNCQKSLQEMDEGILKENMKVNVQIQTEKSYQTEDLEKFSFEQLSNQIIRHLTVLEAINNSLLAEGKGNKEQNRESKAQKDYGNLEINKDYQRSQTLLISQECEKQKETEGKSSHMDESKYFRLSQSQFVLNPAQKLKLLQKFNKQQNDMFKKLFQSLISCQSSENSRMSVKQQIQERVFQSQICRKDQLYTLESQKQLLKTDKGIMRMDSSKFMNSSSAEGSHQLIDDSEFVNLQKLMRDRGMKESILGSNQGHKSFDSESLLSIVDSQIVEKLQKFNPEALKKIIINNDQ